jgi:hypothetical protein
MPLQDPFPTLEIGPFYCTYEDERWDEPEIIVDPVTGFVVAIMPAPQRSVWQRPPKLPARQRPLWRDKLSRWLCLAAVGGTISGRT